MAGERWVQKPLAIAIVGGMLTGTVLILLVMLLWFRFLRREKAKVHS
jgi:Cu/Ag efflux pump CusA